MNIRFLAIPCHRYSISALLRLSNTFALLPSLRRELLNNPDQLEVGCSCPIGNG